MITRMLLAVTGLTFTGLAKRTYFRSSDAELSLDSKSLGFMFLGLSTLLYMTQAIFSF